MADNILNEGAVQVLGEKMGQAFMSIVTNLLPTILQPVFGDTARQLSEQAAQGLRNVGNELKEQAKGLLDIYSDVDFSKMLKIDLELSNLPAQLEELKKSMEKGNLFESLLGAKQAAILEERLSSVGIDAKEAQEFVGNMVNTLEPLASKEFLISLGVSAGANAAYNLADSLLGKYREMEKEIMAVNKRAAETTIQFVSPDEEQGLNTVSKAVDQYRQTILETAIATRASQEETESAYRAFAAAGLNVERFRDDVDGLNISFDTYNSQLASGKTAHGEFTRSASSPIDKMNGLTAIMHIAKGAGLDYTEVAQDMAVFTKELGLTAQEAGERFGIFAEVKSRTNLGMSEVRNTLMANARALRFFGDTTESVGSIYARFLDTLSEGEQSLAAEFVQQITSGLDRMNSGVKAFIAQASGMGGGRGALAGSLELEEAMASGDQDAINDVLNKVTEQIENLSGARLMSREEALATGQEDQFFIQRELLNTLGLGSGNAMQDSKLLEMLSKGQGALALDGARGLETLASQGVQRIDDTQGTLESGFNAAEVTKQLAATEGISAHISEASANFKSTSDNLLNFAEKVQSWGLPGPSMSGGASSKTTFDDVAEQGAIEGGIEGVLEEGRFRKGARDTSRELQNQRTSIQEQARSVAEDRFESARTIDAIVGSERKRRAGEVIFQSEDPPGVKRVDTDGSSSAGDKIDQELLKVIYGLRTSIDNLSSNSLGDIQVKLVIDGKEIRTIATEVSKTVAHNYAKAQTGGIRTI